jgi:hypothetical protein
MRSATDACRAQRCAVKDVLVSRFTCQVTFREAADDPSAADRVALHTARIGAGTKLVTLDARARQSAF